ncbi:hypothetical protein QCA50_019909 [Cerrena zonata]|uniref:Maintenance of telomere capping protein 1 n=1 Tax=Cerrena zonata TaxID=2478898 RepID=A0AAW0F9Z8_9APHY
MTPPKKQQDTDDVLDFINSLPDSKSGTPKPEEGENKEELLDFLDELTAHERTPVQTSKGKFEPKKPEEVPEKTAEKVPEKLAENEKEKETPVLNANEELELDPIGSISNWWSKEGSNKVSSLWGSITSNAATISETTYQIASTTSNQISQQRQKFLKENLGVTDIINNDELINISNRLNSILLNMSQQIKEGLISDEDELLNILIIYDFQNLHNLDQLCYEKFHKVMNQVEGGIKVSVNNFNNKNEVKGDKINLNMFQGQKIDGEKLCFANLDGSIKDYIKMMNLEEELKKIGDHESDEKISQINKSNIFISIQPINVSSQAKLGEDAPIIIESNNGESFVFTMILKDITNNITIINKSQPFPLKWSRWLQGEHPEFDQLFTGEEDIEPGEWVKEWINDGLSLSFAVLAQEYVSKRMGV